MELLAKACQIVIALVVFNVWVLRPNKPTPFRGGNATTLREEFAVYGLPSWSFDVVRVVKLGFAALLLVGLGNTFLAMIGAWGIAALMLGAVAVHFKISDPVQKSMPAAVLLLLSLVVAFSA